MQVKSTPQGYTQSDRRLKVKITDSEMKRLAAYPAPTYVIADSNQVSPVLQKEQWHSLDENGIRQIVDDVNAWYDAKSDFAA